MINFPRPNSVDSAIGGRRAIAKTAEKLAKFRILEILEFPQNTMYGVRVESSFYAKNELNRFIRFDRTPSVTDKQTDTGLWHTPRSTYASGGKNIENRWKLAVRKKAAVRSKRSRFDVTMDQRGDYHRRQRVYTGCSGEKFHRKQMGASRDRSRD